MKTQTWGKEPGQDKGQDRSAAALSQERLELAEAGEGKDVSFPIDFGGSVAFSCQNCETTNFCVNSSSKKQIRAPNMAA